MKPKKTESFTVAVCRKVTEIPEPIILNQSFSVSEILRFYAYDRCCTKKDGSFKKFMLQGLLILKNETSFQIYSTDTANLKKILKQFAKECIKTPIIEYKNGDERRGINWKYNF